MKLIKLGTDTSKYIDLLEPNDIIWYQPYGYKTISVPMYLCENKVKGKVYFISLLPGYYTSIVIRSSLPNPVTSSCMERIYGKAIRLKPEVFKEVKQVLIYVCAELNKQANLKLNSEAMQQKIIDLLTEPRVSSVLTKFSRGSLNLTPVVQRQLGMFLHLANWKRKSGNLELLDAVAPYDLAGVLMENGMTSDKFELRILDYTKLYERRIELTKEMNLVLTRNNGY